MDNTVVQPILTAVRYGIVAVGTFLVAKGYVSADTVSEFATAAVAFGAAVWGVVSSFRKSSAIKNG